VLETVIGGDTVTEAPRTRDALAALFANSRLANNAGLQETLVGGAVRDRHAPPVRRDSCTLRADADGYPVRPPPRISAAGGFPTGMVSRIIHVPCVINPG